MRADGHAARSICRILREQGHQIAARTYRAQRNGVVASRTVTDVEVVVAVRDTAWVTVADIAGHKRRVLNPKGLYRRRNMTTLNGIAPCAAPVPVPHKVRPGAATCGSN